MTTPHPHQSGRGEIQPYDSDHTALVHVLWAAQRGGITISDPDVLAAQVMRSKWFDAVRLHARQTSVDRYEAAELRALLAMAFNALVLAEITDTRLLDRIEARLLIESSLSSPGSASDDQDALTSKEPQS